MKKTRNPFQHLAKALALLTLLIVGSSYFQACKHEPIIPDITDTTGTDTTDIVDTTDIIIDTSAVDTTSTPPQSLCDPDSAYFVQDILPIFVANCATSGCHDAATHEEGVILDNYEHIYDEIDPYDLDNSVFKLIIEDNNSNRMPPSPMPRLSAMQTLAIANWILQGAPNNSCEEPVFTCNTTNVSLSATVYPILQNYCIGCHSSSNASGGINLSTYNNLKATALDGTLFGSINHSSGYVAMPQGLPKLNQCSIDRIKSWIDAGAPNN